MFTYYITLYRSSTWKPVSGSKLDENNLDSFSESTNTYYFSSFPSSKKAQFEYIKTLHDAIPRLEFKVKRA